MPYFVDCPETDNIDCELDGMVELAKSDDNIVCVSVTCTAALVFSIVAGVYTITSADLTAAFFEVGDRIIIRGSVDATGLINNDGCYTVVTNPAGSITVEEPVVACTSSATTAAGGLRVDEYATFILHPTKRTGQMLIWLNAVAALAKFDVSVAPGGFWASKIETICPVYQGSGVASKTYLLQIETAPYLQTEEEDLYTDAVTIVDKKGTILLRVFPGTAGDPLLVDEMEVAYIMLA